MGLIDAFPINLDDRKFDDIVNEARILLARYGKEWTDYNISDPGITFIELFAWLAEMQIYQLNRVSDANYRKFLKLVGIYPAIAQPARVDITFKDVKQNNLKIKAGTKVITEIGTEKLIFETEEPLTMIAGKISSVLTKYDNQTIDNTKANEKGDVYFSAFGEKAPEGAILKLGFDKSFPGEEIKVTFVLLEEKLKPEGKHDIEPSIIFPSATLIWEYNTGGKSKQLSIRKDTTYALTRSGRVVFDWPTDIDNDKNVYWIQCRISQGKYEIVPRLSMILLNTISVVQIEKIRIEEKGWGIPDQIIKLNKVPYINRIEFAPEDILDWTGLLGQLKLKGNSADPGPEKIIFSFLVQDIRDCINGWNRYKEPDEIFKLAFIESLNRILKTRDLYDSKSFKDLSQLPKKFLNQELVYCSDLEMKTLNRFLIESVFPAMIERNRLVIQLETYLFSWNEIPGNDEKRLKEFLTTKYRIDWIKNAVFETIDDGKTIKVSTEKNYLSIKLNDEKPKVNLRIDDGRTDDFIAKIKDNKLNIYESEYWYGIEDFELSGPEDTHCIFNKEKNEIIFGNGLNGRIPNDSQDILISFKTTLGPGGNIPKEKEFIIKEPGIGTIHNNEPATNGKAAESLEEAKIRAKKECREIYRTITSDDYEYLALNTPGLRVARAKAIPNYDPDIQMIKMPDTVTVVAVPYMREGKINSDFRDENITPAAGEGFLKTILQHLNKHRLITTNIRVINPEYKKITISCNIYLKKDKSPKREKIELIKKLNQFLSPIKGGPDGKGWPFGKSVYPSEIYQIIDTVEGVDYAANLSFIDDKGQYHKDIIKISPISLVYPGEHQLKIMEA